MSEIMFVQGHVTMCTKIEVEASSAFPTHADDAVFSTGITNHIRMTNTNRGIIINTKIVGRLISNTIAKRQRFVRRRSKQKREILLGSGTGIPLHDDGFVGRRVTTGFAEFDHRADVTFAIILLRPFPIGTANLDENLSFCASDGRSEEDLPLLDQCRA